MRYQMLGLTLATIVGLAVIPKAASAQVLTSHACNGSNNPASNEVYIYVDAGWPITFGKCAALFVGFYPTAANFGLPNDSISSFKTGSGVRVRFFKDADYTSSGGPDIEPAAESSFGMKAGWNDVVSSIKVDDASRAQNCRDLRAGEFGIWTDINFAGDCTVLKYGSSYPTTAEMGMQDSAISSLDGGFGPSTGPCTGGTGGWQGTFFDNANFNTGNGSFNVNPGTAIMDLRTTGWNDRIGSISTGFICPP